MRISMAIDRLLKKMIRSQRDVDGSERIQLPLPRYICFLGASGIGKSTLINTLVGDGISVVPAGGIGPFTALAIAVEYGAQVSLKAEYHSKDLIYGLIRNLSKIFERSDQTQEKVIIYLTHKNIYVNLASVNT